MDRTYYRALDTNELIEKANEIGGEIVIALAERLEDEFEDHLSEKDELLAQISDLMDEISQLQNAILKIEEDTEQ